MALGDGVRRNIAYVDPTERDLLRDAIIALNTSAYVFPGNRDETPPGGVTWWFKQDEIHQATHVHLGPEFLPWHRKIVNTFEDMIRQVNPNLSLHYWDWEQDPRDIPNANLGNGKTGPLSLFTPDFMGYGGATEELIGPPWQNDAAPWRPDGFYVPDAKFDRDSTGNAADPPLTVKRSVGRFGRKPAPKGSNDDIVNAGDYAEMRNRLESIHNNMHGFVDMGDRHFSFRDPFVFLLHSNVDRLFAMWQLRNGPVRQLQPDPINFIPHVAPQKVGGFIEGPAVPAADVIWRGWSRWSGPNLLDPDIVYGSETNDPGLNGWIEPWSTGQGEFQTIRPWEATHEHLGARHTYKHLVIVLPRCYDTIDCSSPALVVAFQRPEDERASQFPWPLGSLPL